MESAPAAAPLNWRVETRQLSMLTPYEHNPRQITPEQFDKLKKSLQDDGYHARIACTPDGVILAGHMRCRALIELGWTEAECLIPDRQLTIPEIKRINIRDNVDFGHFDKQVLSDHFELNELFELGLKIELTPPDKKPEGDKDVVPEPPKVPRTQPGDIYQIGPHRLFCSDSAELEDVLFLMDGKQASVAFTDPPWNVNYGDVEKGNKQGYKPRKIMNDHMEADAWKAFCEAIVACLAGACADGAPVYVVMSAQEWPVIDAAMRPHFHWSSTIIWAKDRLVLSRKDYHTQYEPIWYGWKEGSARLRPLEDRTQSDLWAIPRPSKSELHPTTKPVDLPQRAIENSSKPGDLVVDLFGGSGSTMVGAHIINRRANLMELDPAYCDVIVQRMVNLFPKLAGQITCNGEKVEWQQEKKQ